MSKSPRSPVMRDDYIQPAEETLSDNERRRTATDRAQIIKKGHNQKL